MAVVVGIDEHEKKRVTCRHCASIIEYTENDKSTWDTSCCGDRGTATGLNCPGCGKTIVLSST